MKTTNRFRLAVGSAALAISMLALSGCGGGSAEGPATGGGSKPGDDSASENWDSRLSISAVNGDSTEKACANLLGTPAEFAQEFGIDPENLAEPGDSWDQKVSRWSSEERREKTATFICDVHYRTPGYTGGDSNGNAATYTLRFLAGSGEGGASIEQGGGGRYESQWSFVLNEGGDHTGADSIVEGDGVFLGLGYNTELPKEFGISDSQATKFLTDEVFSEVRP